MWRRDTFQLVARVKHGSKFQPYVRVVDDLVVVPGSSRHTTRLLVYKNNRHHEGALVALREFNHGSFWVLGADIDRVWLLTLVLFAYGSISTRELRLWDVVDGACLRTCDLGGGVAGSIGIKYPHVAVSSGSKVVSIWDIQQVLGRCRLLFFLYYRG